MNTRTGRFKGVVGVGTSVLVIDKADEKNVMG
jgi:hypothetical protein